MANYECIASNGVEPSDSYMVKLHVMYPPQVEAVQDKVVAAKGSDIRLQCKAQAWPRPHFVWEFNKHVLTSDPSKYHMVSAEDGHWLARSLNTAETRFALGFFEPILILIACVP